ncbi:hypothetical protein BLOT_004556 [Blomia tropicalis]|nr:hypothetical protein BLOT_004556 [Blomia tropicalis]
MRKRTKARKWTKMEDLKLTRLVNLYGRRWKHISNFIKNRNDNMCKKRYKNLVKNKPNTETRYIYERPNKRTRSLCLPSNQSMELETYQKVEKQTQTEDLYLSQINKPINYADGLVYDIIKKDKVNFVKIDNVNEVNFICSSCNKWSQVLVGKCTDCSTKTNNIYQQSTFNCCSPFETGCVCVLDDKINDNTLLEIIDPSDNIQYNK